jgi:hypothetical protein
MTRVIEIVRRGRPGADGASGVVQVLRSAANITVSSANRGFAVIADAAITVQLPPASGIGAAWSAWFLAEGGALTLTSASDINGSSSDLVIPLGYSAQVVTDGTEYFVQFGISTPILTVNTNSIGNESDLPGAPLTTALNGVNTSINTLIGRTISAEGLATGGGTLSADRTITVPIASQILAEAGLDNQTAMTPLTTRQAIAAQTESLGAPIYTATEASWYNVWVKRNHGLARSPRLVQTALVCTSDNNGYVVGDRLLLGSGQAHAGSFSGAHIYANGTEVGVYCGEITVRDKSTGGGVTLNASTNWTLEVAAW